MKKLLFMIVVVALSLMLIGCSGETKMTPKGWALHYVVEEYNREYEGHEIFAYSIEPLIIYDRERVEEFTDKYSFVCYRIIITNDNGKDTSYNVLILYTEKGLPPFITFNHIKESQIYDVDIEKGE